MELLKSSVARSEASRGRVRKRDNEEDAQREEDARRKSRVKESKRFRKEEDERFASILAAMESGNPQAEAELENAIGEAQARQRGNPLPSDAHLLAAYYRAVAARGQERRRDRKDRERKERPKSPQASPVSVLAATKPAVPAAVSPPAPARGVL